MQYSPFHGDFVVSSSATDDHSAGFRSRELRLLRLRAETFEVELKREKERCLATGHAMPPEWASSLERERKEILDQIQTYEHSLESIRDSQAISKSSIYSPTPHAPSRKPAPNVVHEIGRGRSSVPHPTQSKERSDPRPATVHPIVPHVPHTVIIDRETELEIRVTGQNGSSETQLRPKLPRIPSISIPKRVMPYPRPFLLPPPIIGPDRQTTPTGGSDSRSARPHPEPSSSPYLSRSSTPTLAHPYRVQAPVFGQSGRRSARGWYPQPVHIEEDFHRTSLLSPDPDPTPPSAPQRGEYLSIKDIQHSDTFTRDEEPGSRPTPTLSDSHQLNIREQHSTSIEPYNVHSHTPLSNFTFSSSGNLDELNSTKLRAMGTNISSTGLALQMGKIYTSLMDVFHDLAKYNQFLSYRDEDAQHLLNFLQTLLDYSQLEEQFRCTIFVALLRLSRKSELVPECLTLTDVKREGEYPLAEGNFGEVYRGYFQNKVISLKVVKVYHKSDHNRLLKAFSREAVLWRQLSHINVLPFYGIFRLKDRRNRIGLVSPWIEHGDINDYLLKHPHADRQLLVSDVANGMLYLHSNGVIHGDLKGGNILVTMSGRACLADFGLSCVVDPQGLKTPSLSSAGPEGGTVRFQAPELIDPGSAGLRSQASDVYAFALVCYEIFTGSHPFPDIPNNYTVMFKVICGERPARPRGVLYRNYGLTDTMWELMEDCWKQVPADRPTASLILARLPPRVDMRPQGGWGDLASRFRTLDGHGRSDKYDLSFIETLRVLESIGGFAT